MNLGTITQSTLWKSGAIICATTINISQSEASNPQNSLTLTFVETRGGVSVDGASCTWVGGVLSKDGINFAIPDLCIGYGAAIPPPDSIQARIDNPYTGLSVTPSINFP